MNESQSKFCRYCGTKRANEDVFCAKCGAKFTTTTQEQEDTVTPTANKPSQTSPQPISQTQTSNTTKKKLYIPSLIALISVAGMLIAFLLPFISMSKDNREYIMERAERYEKKDIDYLEEKLGDNTSLTIKDSMDMNLPTLAYLYFMERETYWDNEAMGIFYLVIIGIHGLLTLLTATFGALKKRIPTLIFALLSMIGMIILCWDFMDRNVVGSKYSFGIGVPMYFIFGITTFVMSIILRVKKR